MIQAAFVVFLMFFTHSAFCKTIVIVGAGLSGLTAAWDLQHQISSNPQLKNQDLKVEIYEARERVGGRIFTVKLNELPAEMGGENLRDSHNPATLYRLLKEVGLETKTYESSRTNSAHFDPVAKKAYFIRDLLPALPRLSDEQVEKIISNSRHNSRNLVQVIDNIFAQFSALLPKDQLRLEKINVLKQVLYRLMASYEGGRPESLSV